MSKFGDHDVLQHCSDVQVPEPGPNEVLIKVYLLILINPRQSEFWRLS